MKLILQYNIQAKFIKTRDYFRAIQDGQSIQGKTGGSRTG